MTSSPALQAPLVTIRTATAADHDALQALEGAAPDSRARMLQARLNFFSRMAAYDRTQVLVAEVAHEVVGVQCLALTPVRVAGQPCAAGYSFNTRVAPGYQTRGLGTRLMKAGAEWLERQGCRYVTGLIGVSNIPSMKMVRGAGLGVRGALRLSDPGPGPVPAGPGRRYPGRWMPSAIRPMPRGASGRSLTSPPSRAPVPGLRAVHPLPQGGPTWAA